VERVARLEQMRNTCRILVRKREDEVVD